MVPGGVEGRQERIQAPVNGVSPNVETGVGYCLGVIGNESVRAGSALGPEDWAKIKSSLPEVKARDFGSTVAVDFTLQPQEEKVIRYILAWYAPQWHGDEQKKYTQTYTTRFKNAVEVADLLAREHVSLLRRVLAWQEAIYTDDALPGWLEDTLINVLATIPEDSYLAMPKNPIDWAPVDGLFGLNESLGAARKSSVFLAVGTATSPLCISSLSWR